MDDVPVTRSLMQVVDILRDQQKTIPQRLFQLRASGHTSLPAGGGKAVFHGRFAAKKI